MFGLAARVKQRAYPGRIQAQHCEKRQQGQSCRHREGNREGIQRRQYCTEHGGAHAETHLPVHVPQRAGVAHALGGNIQKGQGLCGAAAQAAAQAHQDVGRNNQRRLVEQQDTAALQRHAGQ